MSSDVAAEAAPAKNLDKNAQAAEEAKKMLAELQGSTEKPTTEKANGDVTKDSTAAEEDKVEQSSEDKTEETDSRQSNERRHRDGGRSFRGGRGGFQDRKSYRENIKSDLTTQEESNDPAAIRKQVHNDLECL